MGVAKVIEGDIPKDLAPVIDQIREGKELENAKKVGEKMLFEEVRGHQDVRHYVDYYARFGV